VARQSRSITNIKLVNLLVFLRGLPPLSSLTGDEERLLFAIYGALQNHSELSVSDVYELVADKSAASAYRRLMSLQKKGLVHIGIDDFDKRRRRIALTKAADNFFASFP